MSARAVRVVLAAFGHALILVAAAMYGLALLLAAAVLICPGIDWC